MQPSPAQLPTAGVHRQLAIQRNARAAFDELMALAHLADAKAFEPGNWLKGKAVIKLNGIKVFGGVIGIFPKIAARRIRRCPFGLIPAVPFTRAGRRRDADRGGGDLVERIARRNDYDGRGIGKAVAII